MTDVNEDVLFAPSFVKDCTSGMETVSVGIELTLAIKQSALAIPLTVVPVAGIHTPDPELHSMAFRPNDFESFGHRIEAEVHGVDQSRILQISLGDGRFLTGYPTHLSMSAHLILIPRDKEVLAVAKQCCRLVLLKAGRIFLGFPGSTAISGAEDYELI